MWEVLGSYRVVQLLYQSSSRKVLDNLLKCTEFSRSHCERHYYGMQ